jgi:hydrogenase maturation protease
MTRISPHQLGFPLLLQSTLQELPKQMVLFGIEPKVISLGLEMTDEVKGSFEKLLGVVVDELKRIGSAPEVLEECAYGKQSIWRNV